MAASTETRDAAPDTALVNKPAAVPEQETASPSLAVSSTNGAADSVTKDANVPLSDTVQNGTTSPSTAAITRKGDVDNSPSPETAEKHVPAAENTAAKPTVVTPSRQKNDISTSSASDTTTTPKSAPKTSTEKERKPSFFSKLLHKLPCLSTSRAHDIDLAVPLAVAPAAGASATKAARSEPTEKADKKQEQQDSTSAVPPPVVPESTTTPSSAVPLTSSEPKSEEKEAKVLSAPAGDAPPPLSLVPPIALTGGDVILPPTPISQLLPQAETEGVTSGAVQPPGSTGGTSIHEHHNRKRDSATSVPTEGEDSDGTTSYTDDDGEESNPMDDLDDEEDRLINNGGAGIPIGPDGVPRPLLPPISPQHAGRKCLVLDLDETLVHSSFKSIQQADYVVPVEIEFQLHNVYVIKRPGVDNFLKKMGEIYEVVVFTASLSKYADPVLDKLDIHKVVSHRLFRESCYNHKGNYVKDLSQLGRPIADTIILDNSPASYIFHPNNAVPVSSWFNDPHDTELTDLVPFLTDLAPVDDVRGVLDGAR